MRFLFSECTLNRIFSVSIKQQIPFSGFLLYVWRYGRTPGSHNAFPEIYKKDLLFFMKWGHLARRYHVTKWDIFRPSASSVLCLWNQTDIFKSCCLDNNLLLMTGVESRATTNHSDVYIQVFLELLNSFFAKLNVWLHHANGLAAICQCRQPHFMGIPTLTSIYHILSQCPFDYTAQVVLVVTVHHCARRPQQGPETVEKELKRSMPRSVCLYYYITFILINNMIVNNILQSSLIKSLPQTCLPYFFEEAVHHKVRR